MKFNLEKLNIPNFLWLLCKKDFTNPLKTCKQKSEDCIQVKNYRMKHNVDTYFGRQDLKSSIFVTKSKYKVNSKLVQ